jgi:ribosomal protein S18 acetylase RimI-like enzyme
MSSAVFEIGPLRPHHDKSSFSCGSDALDSYLKTQASQDIRRKLASCFVATTDDARVVGFYTLASSSLPITDLPTETRKRLPGHVLVPAVRIGRLAVDQSCSGRGLGSALLANAIRRTLASGIASFAVVVDAKDEAAARFYAHHGSIALPDAALTLFLPMATVRALMHKHP